MDFIIIIIGTLAAGVGSVWIAGALTFGVLARYTQHLLSMAAGALLATAFMNLLPEAFESQARAHDLFVTLLGGLIFFFLLDKAELYHHGHEHAHHHAHHDVEATAHAHDHPHTQAHADAQTHAHNHGGGGWAVLLGDSVHCFGDGVLLAAAYMANFQLGVAATLAVLAHEVPHHIGDLVVLRKPGSSMRQALLRLSAAGFVTVIGGVVGYLLVDKLQGISPYLLVVAASSFIYVALADLIPQLQKRLTLLETTAQVAWLAVGLLAITLLTGLGHAH
jgi:zinc and cadmium transporter